ncbi:MAG: ABC transporter permease [Alphaproteobacteria bacterium]
MLMLDISMGLRALWLHRLRSGLTMLGVVFGVASVVAMLAVGEGASREALENIRKLGSRNIIITAEKPRDDALTGASNARMLMYGLDRADPERIRAGYPDLVSAVVAAKLVRKQARQGAQEMELRVVGTGPDWFRLIRREVLAGRLIVPADMAGLNQVAVLTDHGARRLLSGSGGIGATVRIGGEAFTVIGIVKAEGTDAGLTTPDQPIDAYIPLPVAQRRFGDVTTRRAAGSRSRERVELHAILVESATQEHVLPLARGLDRLLTLTHPARDWSMQVPLELLKQAEETKRRFNIVLGSIAAISLLVGGIGIMNIMLASVTERTREIGIRRALGARKRQIMRQFLVETLVLSGIGGLAGLAVGLILPALITHATGLPTSVTLWSAGLAFGVAFITGLIFGLYPAARAASLDPVAALRHD